MALSKTFFSPVLLRYLTAISCVFVSACDPISLFLVPTAVVVCAEVDERRLGGVASDAGLRTKINYVWLTQEPRLIDQVSLSVIEGRVVLTGTVETLELKQRAVSLTHKISGVKEIKDEMRVGPGESFRDYSRDSWITTNLKTTLLFDSRIFSRNYTIRSVNRTIYLMGIAQNQQELDWVLEHAKGISGVKRVVSHVRVKPVSIGSAPSSSIKETDEDAEESSAAG